MDSLAFVLTKYQFNILLALLDKMGIDKSSIVLIIHQKARENLTNNNTKGFKKVIDYPYEMETPISTWRKLKNNVKIFCEENIDFYPKNIFIRNFDTAIGRCLLSNFKKTNIYLLEDGIASYRNRYIFGFSKYHNKKDILKDILFRAYFSKGLLKLLPFSKKHKLYKVGFFETIEPWLKNIDFIEINIDNKIENNKSIDTIKVIILEQPLWQHYFSDEDVSFLYKELFNYLTNIKKYNFSSIGLKLHPSTDSKRVLKILEKINIETSKLVIIKADKNFEEVVFQYKSLEIIVGFFSSALYVSKSIFKNSNIDIVSFGSKKTFQYFKEDYELLNSLGIKVKGEK